mmetsp:Transcript_14316/g.32687  ORF Transcript_14316/g.32687 Transcript_14316/m.32687 type:complete len:319 (+) Transcript_14316:604-1560(+)
MSASLLPDASSAALLGSSAPPAPPTSLSRGPQQSSLGRSPNSSLAETRATSISFAATALLDASPIGEGLGASRSGRTRSWCAGERMRASRFLGSSFAAMSRCKRKRYSEAYQRERCAGRLALRRSCPRKSRMYLLVVQTYTSVRTPHTLAEMTSIKCALCHSSEHTCSTPCESKHAARADPLPLRSTKKHCCSIIWVALASSKPASSRAERYVSLPKAERPCSSARCNWEPASQLRPRIESDTSQCSSGSAPLRASSEQRSAKKTHAITTWVQMARGSEKESTSSICLSCVTGGGERRRRKLTRSTHPASHRKTAMSR